jgi:hypothetical protein
MTNDRPGQANEKGPPAVRHSQGGIRGAGDVFVGRQQEMAELKAALEDTLLGGDVW